MTWFRVDDKFHGHPKVKGLKAKDPLSLWLLCGSWCADHPGQDGFVPRHVAEDFAGSRGAADRSAAILTRRGLWVAEEGGWRFHDWEVYQLLGSEVDAKREELSKKRALAGKAGAARRWQNDGKHDGKTAGKAPDATMAKMATDGSLSLPVPIPKPSEIPPNPPEGGGDQPKVRTGIPRGTALADAVVLAYAEGVSAATGKPYAIPHSERWGLAEAVHAHAPPELLGRELVPWTRERAETYARSHAGHESYERGFAPSKFRAWLNGGAKPPSTGNRPAIASPVQAAPEGGSRWRIGQDADLETPEPLTASAHAQRILRPHAARSPARSPTEQEPHDDRRDPSDGAGREPPELRTALR